MTLICPSNMVSLTEGDIILNIKEFLCDDSSDESYLKIISSPQFEPESFTIGEREKEPQYLDLSERDFQDWCNNIIKDQLLRMAESEELSFYDMRSVIAIIKKNLITFLNFNYKNNNLKNVIWNQEFIDVLDKIIIFSFYGNLNTTYSTHKKYRDISREIIPLIIKRINDNNLELKDYLKLSIISGISGLDLKGSNAASSKISQIGIPMAPYYDKNPMKSAELYYCNLMSKLNSPTPIFEWDHFLNQIKSNNAKIVWFTDDYIETYFDLLFINKLLSYYDNIYVSIVPKRGVYGNDASYLDVLEILKLCQNDYNTIHKLLRCDERFNLSKFGPSMGAVNIKKLSNQVVDLIDKSDLIMIKGCRAHEMVQGGLNKITYNMYVVAREFSESVTGFDSREMPLLFFHLPPGSYSFKGFKYRYMRKESFRDGKKVFLSKLTLKDIFKLQLSR